MFVEQYFRGGFETYPTYLSTTYIPFLLADSICSIYHPPTNNFPILQKITMFATPKNIFQ